MSGGDLLALTGGNCLFGMGILPQLEPEGIALSASTDRRARMRRVDHTIQAGSLSLERVAGTRKVSTDWVCDALR